MISGAGSVKVDRLRVSVSPGGNDPDIPVGNNPTQIDDPNTQLGLDGRIENDYSYLIVKPS
jgi:hypothetical protein